MSEKSFDASRYLVTLKGRDYLEVKWRLLWLRTEHPEAVIETDMVRLDEGYAVFKAKVSVPNGGSATGWGSEEVGDFPDYLEKAECVPLRSEILTRDGFKTFDQVQVGEEVLAYDVEHDRTVWTPLQQIAVFPRGRVIALENNAGWRVECTDDHSWAIQRDTSIKMERAKVRELRKACHLKTSDAIILAAPAPGGDHPLTPIEAAILGWLFTDGHIRPNGRGMIAQAKEPYVTAIRALVGAVAREYTVSPRTRTFPTGKTYQTRESYQWHLSTTVVRPLLQKADISTGDDLPKLVTRLTVEARRAMLDAFMAAESDARGNFAQKPGPVFEAFQILATLEGKALTPQREASFGGVRVQRVKKRRRLCVSELTTQEVNMLPVWCPTTAFGTWIMRQDGIVTITGNTKALGRALAALGFGTQFTEDFEFRKDGEQAVVDTPVQRPEHAEGEHPQRRQAADTRPNSGVRQVTVPGGGNASGQATPAQVNAIYAIGRREYRWSDEEVDGYCRNAFGKLPAELTKREASELIDRLKTAAPAA